MPGTRDPFANSHFVSYVIAVFHHILASQRSNFLPAVGSIFHYFYFYYFVIIIIIYLFFNGVVFFSNGNKTNLDRSKFQTFTWF